MRAEIKDRNPHLQFILHQRRGFLHLMHVREGDQRALRKMYNPDTDAERNGNERCRCRYERLEEFDKRREEKVSLPAGPDADA